VTNSQRAGVQISLAGVSVLVAVAFIIGARDDRFLQLVGGVILLFIALVQVSLVISTERSK
jgi:uncharacterized membrane protein YkgB